MVLNNAKLHWVDLLVIGLYYVVTLAIGVWSICKTKNNLNSFLLADRAITWWAIGMSLFASNIGSINFVGIAGSAAASGFAVVMFEWMAVFHLMLLAWIFVPVYVSSGIFTIPEYLNKRFGGQRLRIYLTIIALFTYIFGIVSVDLYSGSLFIQHTLNLNLFIGVAIILATTVLFTTLGGLMTVVLTDAFAVVVMISGGILLFIIGMVRIGGFKELHDMYMNAVPNITSPNNTCGLPREDAFHIFRNSLTADYPGLGTVLRTFFGAIWFWCSNQMIVQRSLAAKNIVHAKGASLLASILKLTPMLIMVLPGMISRALFPNEVACSTPETCLEVCGNEMGCSNIAYPKLVTELLPQGLRGLLVAAMIAAVISSLTSAFNSSSSLFSIDVWKRIRPNAKERELLIAGKVFVVFLTVISVIWIPIMENAEGGQIYRYAVATVGLFGGPTCALFILALFCNWISEPGAFWGLIVGQVWGVARFVLDVVYPAPVCGHSDTRPVFLKYWHVYYHTFSQILLTSLVAFIISCFTKPMHKKNLVGLTFWTHKMKPEEDEALTTRSSETKSADKETEMILLNSGEEVIPGEQPTVKILKFSILEKSLCGKIISMFFIGDSKELFDKKTGENCEEIDVRLESLKETTFWKSFLNMTSILIMSITIGLYIYLR